MIHTLMKLAPFSWPSVTTLQLSGRLYGCWILRVETAFAFYEPLRSPTPVPLLQSSLQVTETLWPRCDDRTCTSMVTGREAFPLARATQVACLPRAVQVSA